ncbi:hypothetical protein DTW90_37355 [Neorhizobium sp. P12A]|uniref:hypothetical protein n=1 Tax=Rhizobium/Agrobacterium group TaxID=227290 RepID=UPI0010517656|nr:MULTISPECIES: hypothetical protein [Rhizobium/Agrobacterium group]KAA0680252.1 hypothetical protein DTW90_37355 [Neorhizobium sp. P12A]
MISLPDTEVISHVLDAFPVCFHASSSIDRRLSGLPLDCPLGHDTLTKPSIDPANPQPLENPFFRNLLFELLFEIFWFSLWLYDAPFALKSFEHVKRYHSLPHWLLLVASRR